MTRACVALLAGALAVQLSSFPLQSDRIAVLLVASIVLLPHLRRQDLLLFFCGGGLVLHAVLAVFAQRLDPAYEGDSMLVDLRIDDFPVSRFGGYIIVASPVRDPRVPPRIRLGWQQPPVAPRLGDVWQLEVRLRRPRATANPGVPDREAWLFRERVGATGYVVAGQHLRLLQSGTATGVEALRMRLLARISRLLGETDAAAVLAAVTIGARHRLSAEQWERYARTGTVHLMAISGLHIGLAAGVGFLLARLLAIILPVGNPRRLALWAALMAAGAYVLVSGIAVPAQRAILMLGVMTLFVLARRQPAPPGILLFAATAIVIADPIAVSEPGFQLSFAAVAALIWMARRKSRRMPSLARPVVALAILQLGLFLGLAPLGVQHFSRISLVSIGVNLIAVPVFSIVIVPAALFGISADSPVTDLSLRVAADGIERLDALINHLAALPYADVRTAALDGIGRFVVLLPMVWVLMPPGWPGRSSAFVALAAICCWRPEAPVDRCIRLHVLDVGQGMAVVVQGPTRTLVYDSGPAYFTGGNAAETVVAPFLASRGIRRIDEMILSHADLDHAGGAADLVSRFEVGRVLSGETIEGVDSEHCVAGQRWAWPAAAAHFEVLHPRAGDAVEGNNASCVLLLAIGPHRILLTGDIEADVESALVRSGRLRQVSVLTVPHHGSRTSSTTPFVRALRPEIAIVSAGWKNRWGFPKPDVSARWQAIGARVLTTASSGALILDACQDEAALRIVEWRRERRRIWHERDS